MDSSKLNKRPLWFEPFLQKLREELGYPFDISKYSRLLSWANAQPWEADTVPMKRLYAVCRLLFLENHEHETAFRNIFMNYVIDELAYEQATLLPPVIQKDGADKTGNTILDPRIDEKKLRAKDKLPKTAVPEPPDKIEFTERQRGKRYLNLTIPGTEDAPAATSNTITGSRFLLSDAYHPLTAREMVQAWRHLRKSEQYVVSDQVNVKATVRSIAQKGMLAPLVFEKDQVNSDDLLLILCDRRGSMTPFHKLSDKLIQTAIKDGGHKNALVYYFHNCPVDVVFKKPNLTEAITLTELYSIIRPDHTNSLIISDAGAARGNNNPGRLAATKNFLYGPLKNGQRGGGLHKSALFVVWLNPMPRHRWANTSAGEIALDPETPMFTLIDNGYLGFLQAVKKLMGK